MTFQFKDLVRRLLCQVFPDSLLGWMAFEARVRLKFLRHGSKTGLRQLPLHHISRGWRVDFPSM